MANNIKSNKNELPFASVSANDYLTINDAETGKQGFVTVADLLSGASAAAAGPSSLRPPLPGAGGLVVYYDSTLRKTLFGSDLWRDATGQAVVDYGDPIAMAITTLDPFNKTSGITLSNGLLTATGSVDTASQVRSVGSASTGKKYCEVNLVNAASAAVGLVTDAWVLGHAFLGNTPAAALGFWFFGDAYINNAVVLSGVGALTGATRSMAFDFDAKLAWTRTDGGNWNNSGTANPATGVGGLSFAALGNGPFYVAGEFNAANSQGVFNFGKTAYSYAAPAGFGNFQNPANSDHAAWGDSMIAGAGSSSYPNTWHYALSQSITPSTQEYNYGVGGESSPMIRARFEADVDATRNRSLINIFWMGHNIANAAQTVADLEAMVAKLTGSKKYLILQPVQSTSNAPGSAGYIACTETRAAISAAFPSSRVVDIPAALAAAVPGDGNLASGWTPSTLLADTIHLNDAGQVIVKNTLRARIITNGW